MTTWRSECQFLDRAVFLPKSSTLVVADLHIGKGTSSNVDAPLEYADNVVVRLADQLEATDAETLVIAGDFLHTFSAVPKHARGVIDHLVDRLDRLDVDLAVIPGNHDTALSSVFDGDRRSERLTSEGILITHGHTRPEADAERIIIGHEHPVLRIDGRRYPCFLFGQSVCNGADVLVVPAYTRLAAGLTVNRGSTVDTQSPLVRDLDRFSPGVVNPDGTRIHWFPKLGRSRNLL